MTEDGPGQRTVVILAGCRCPGGPHQTGDTVTLAPRLTVPMGVAAMQAVANAEATVSDVEAAITRAFLRHGIVAWSFVDEAGTPVPVSGEAQDRLLDWATAHELAERANDLYAEDLFRPLAGRLSRLSPPTPTGGSTSRRKRSGRGHPKRSKRSSSEPTDPTLSEVPDR